MKCLTSRIAALFVLACILLNFNSSRAQSPGNENEKSPVSFGKISIEDFSTERYKLDSSSTSVIVADIGSSKIQGNTKGWFSIMHTHFRRVHILDKNDYDMADIVIRLYVQGNDQEKLTKIRAQTYNLSGDQVEVSELEAKDVFTDKVDKNHLYKKFTLPNVKEGSIIEFEYTTSSDFLFNFQPWSFQGTVRRLWSEYTVEIPQFLQYVSLSYGYQPFYINSQKIQNKSFNVLETNFTGLSDRYRFENPVSVRRMVMKDVPALKEESFTSSLSNHMARIEFQLAGYREPLKSQNIMGDWSSACTRLLEYDDFGSELYKSNSWLNEVVDAIAPKDSSELYKAKAIYNYVRTNFKSNGRNGIYLTKPGLKQVLKDKGGKVADINLLLTAMLRSAGLDAHAMILSTSDNGIANESYPVISQYNYVISRALIQGKNYMLDGSQSKLPFGMLLPNCYNGSGRTIYGRGELVNLHADSLMETSHIIISMKPDDQGGLVAEFSKTPGNYGNIKLRTSFEEDGLPGLRKTTQAGMGAGMTLDSLDFVHGEDISAKSSLRYSYHLANQGEELVAINPLQSEATKNNPFSAMKRNYPVEMPYGFDETIVFAMQVPPGYAVDELPRSMSLSLDDERLCTYRYIIRQEGDRVELMSKFVFKRAVFAPEEYEALRSFFDIVVKKQNEDILLKKI